MCVSAGANRAHRRGSRTSDSPAVDADLKELPADRKELVETTMESKEAGGGAVCPAAAGLPAEGAEAQQPIVCQDSDIRTGDACVSAPATESRGARTSSVGHACPEAGLEQGRDEGKFPMRMVGRAGLLVAQAPPHPAPPPLGPRPVAAAPPRGCQRSAPRSPLRDAVCALRAVLLRAASDGAHRKQSRAGRQSGARSRPPPTQRTLVGDTHARAGTHTH